MCFLPNMMGYVSEYTAAHKGEYDYLDALSSLSLNNSLVASIAVTTAILLENILDSAITLYNYFGTDKKAETSKETNITSFKFPTVILLLIISKDLIVLVDIIPDQHYDFFAGILCAVDIIFSWCFFYNLYRLGGSIFTLPKCFLIMLTFMVGNIISVWEFMSDFATNSKELLLFLQIVIGIGIFSLWCLTAQWFYYVYKLDLEHVSLFTYLRAIQASVFVVFLNIYILAVWTTVFFDTSYDWQTAGASYVVMMTYLMSIGTVIVSLITGRVNKFGAMSFSKVSTKISLFLIFD